MTKKYDAQLVIRMAKERKLELQKIAKGLNMPVGVAARAAIDNFIAYRKRFKGGYYLCRVNKKKRELR